MALPVVAIVGRPNVGKSSLLNVLAGRRISIVDPTAGVTRDRVQTPCDHDGIYFELVDTGGYGIVDRDDLGEQVEQQIRFAVNEATLILFVVDARDGVTPLDQTVAKWLRGSDRPVLLVANKVDAPNMITDIGELPRLGLGEPMAISAMNRVNIMDLKDEIVRRIRPFSEGQVPQDAVMKIALVGKRNVGKSSFINSLAGQERVIVSEVPGTTRDAVDVKFERDGHTYIAIDTAGVRKRGKMADDIEFYSSHRAELSVRRADVVLLLIDAMADISHVDKTLARYITDQFKPCILVINKWDLAKAESDTEKYAEYIAKMLPGMSASPIAFTTATESRKVQSVVDTAAALFKQSRTRVGTAQLNEALAEATEAHLPRPKRGTSPVKILYATQAAVCPPTLVMFVNHPNRVTPEYERFLLNRIRELLPFKQVPIRLLFRGRRAMSPKK